VDSCEIAPAARQSVRHRAPVGETAIRASKSPAVERTFHDLGMEVRKRSAARQAGPVMAVESERVVHAQNRRAARRAQPQVVVLADAQAFVESAQFYEELALHHHRRVHTWQSTRRSQ
jgi:hypothetical protein